MKRLDVGSIQHEVERYYKISHADLVGKRKDRATSLTRQVAMYLCRQMLDIPYNDIGRSSTETTPPSCIRSDKWKKKLTKSRDLQEELELIVKNMPGKLR